MATVPFDTLRMVEQLEHAGIPERQAKAQVAVLAEVVSALDSSHTERFSSKVEVAQELAAIRASIEKLDTKMDAKFQTLDAKIEMVEARMAAKIEKVDAKIEKVDARMAAKLETLDAKIEKVDAKIEKSAAEVKSELIRWVVSVGILQIALIAALLLKLLG